MTRKSRINFSYGSVNFGGAKSIKVDKKKELPQDLFTYLTESYDNERSSFTRFASSYTQTPSEDVWVRGDNSDVANNFNVSAVDVAVDDDEVFVVGLSEVNILDARTGETKQTISFDTTYDNVSTPTVTSDKLYIQLVSESNAESTVYTKAYSRSTGLLIWEDQRTSFTIDGNPAKALNIAVEDGVAYATIFHRGFIALDAETGTGIWDNTSDDPDIAKTWYTKPALSNDYILIGTEQTDGSDDFWYDGDGQQVYRGDECIIEWYNKETGAKAAGPYDEPENYDYPISSDPEHQDGETARIDNLVINTEVDKIVIDDQTYGEAEFRPPWGYISISGTEFEDGSMEAFAEYVDFDGSTAFPNTEFEVQASDVSGKINTISRATDKIYMGTTDGSMYCYKAQSSDAYDDDTIRSFNPVKVWERTDLTSYTLASEPTVTDDVVYFPVAGESAGSVGRVTDVHVLNRATGDLIFSYDMFNTLPDTDIPQNVYRLLSSKEGILGISQVDIKLVR